MDIKLWWSNLAQREQTIVIYGSIAAGLLLFYFAFWSPLQSSIDQLRTRNQKSQELVAWMYQSKSLIESFSTAPKPPKNMGNVAPLSLLPTIEQSIKQHNLDSIVSSIKQLSNNQVDVKFEAVSFLDLIHWLGDAQLLDASNILKIAISRTSDVGVVKVDLTLTAE